MPGVGIVWVALAGLGGVQSSVFLQEVGVGILCSDCFHGLAVCRVYVCSVFYPFCNGLSGAQGSLLDHTASSRHDILQ